MTMVDIGRVRFPLTIKLREKSIWEKDENPLSYFGRPGRLGETPGLHTLLYRVVNSVIEQTNDGVR